MNKKRSLHNVNYRKLAVSLPLWFKDMLRRIDALRERVEGAGKAAHLENAC